MVPPATVLAVPLPPLVPPFRFRTVEEGVAVGAHPTLRNFRFLRRLRLTTLISLIPEEPIPDLVEFCQEHSITLVHIAAEKFKDSPAMMPHDYAEILSLLIDPGRHPLYLHCLDGGNVTGQVLMLLRKLQGWTSDSIIAEYVRWNVQNDITAEETRFVAEFGHPIPLPAALPPWLWGGVAIKNPPLKVTHSAAQSELADDATPSQLLTLPGSARADDIDGPEPFSSAADMPVPPQTALFKWWSTYPDRLREKALAFSKSPSLEIVGHDLRLGHAADSVYLADCPKALLPVPHSGSCSDLQALL